MIFLDLFLTFLKIGIFTFGGGYSMVALIQQEVSVHRSWMTAQEFTDLLAVSQMTPGPIGINTATYAGYTAVANAGFSPILSICGALLASIAVILLPIALMLAMEQFLLRYKQSPIVAQIFRVLRLTVVGLIAAAALQLLTAESFGFPSISLHFIISALIFASVFMLSVRKKSPILLILAAGLVGIIAYGL